MKLPYIVDDLLLTITRIGSVNASMIDRRLLVQWINNQRSLWLANEVNKGREFMNNEIQSLHNVEFKVDTESSVYTTIPQGISLLKSVNKLPRTIQFQVRDGLISIRPQNKQFARFSYIPREQIPYAGNGKYNQNMIYFFKIDDYLYAKYPTDNLRVNIPTNVLVEGIFENPLEVDEFNNTVDYIWDGKDEYPISTKFIEYIKGAILSTNYAPMLSVPTDKNSNDEDDIVNG